jgi:dihydrodipicolinate synthase/N-acetylneuraminate lyase
VLRTFRTDEGELDLGRQRAHLRWLIDSGITVGNGVLMSAGGGSEGYFMNNDEWKAVVELTAELCRGRTTSMAGIFDLSSVEAAKKARFCEEVGIDFVQVAPPHYAAPSEDEVFRHYQAINDAADVGIALYNTPWAMPSPGWEFTPPLIERLVGLRNVEGLKMGTHSDVAHVVRCTLLFRDEINFISNSATNLFSATLSLPIKLGMKGFIHSDGNVAPRLSLHMWDLWQNKRYEEYDALVLKLYVSAMVHIHPQPNSAWPTMGEGPGARKGLEAMGMKLGPPFPAQQAVPDSHIEAARERLAETGIMEWVDWKDEYAEMETAAASAD